MSENKILHAIEKSDPRMEAHCDFLFWCPVCKCGHGIWTKQRNGMGAVWSFNGDMEKPTFQPSLLITQDLWTHPVTPENLKEWEAKPWHQEKVRHVCHSYIVNGTIQYLGDCTHEFAGRTIPMEAF